MIIGIEIFILLFVAVYGGNFLLYRVLKKKQQIQGMEKAAIVFGVNMLILLFASSVLVITLLAGNK